MAEHDRSRVAAVLSADAEFDIFASLSAEVGSDFHQFSNAFLIHVCKRVAFEHAFAIVVIQGTCLTSSREKPNVICVRSFVPNEKNSASCSDLISCQGQLSGFLSWCRLCIRCLKFISVFTSSAVFTTTFLTYLSSARFRYQRYHDFGHDLYFAFFFNLDSSFHNSAGLHFGYRRICD